MLKHEGLHSRRLEPSQNNPREVAFSEQWKHENEVSHVLGVLLSRQEGGHPFMPFTGTHVQLAPCDQHAASVAATVIQWLGSNVGMCFLEESLRQCGFRLQQAERTTPETAPVSNAPNSAGQPANRGADPAKEKESNG